MANAKDQKMRFRHNGKILNWKTDLPKLNMEELVLLEYRLENAKTFNKMFVKKMQGVCCQICNTNAMAGKSSLDAHINGKKHQRTVELVVEYRHKNIKSLSEEEGNGGAATPAKPAAAGEQANATPAAAKQVTPAKPAAAAAAATPAKPAAAGAAATPAKPKPAVTPATPKPAATTGAAKPPATPATPKPAAKPANALATPKAATTVAKPNTAQKAVTAGTPKPGAAAASPTAAKTAVAGKPAATSPAAKTAANTNAKPAVGTPVKAAAGAAKPATTPQTAKPTPAKAANAAAKPAGSVLNPAAKAASLAQRSASSPALKVAGTPATKAAAATKVATSPAAKPAGTPGAKPAGTVAAKPAAKSAGTPAAKPAGTPAAKPAGTPAAKQPAATPATKVAPSPAAKAAATAAPKPAGATPSPAPNSSPAAKAAVAASSPSPSPAPKAASAASLPAPKAVTPVSSSPNAKAADKTDAPNTDASKVASNAMPSPAAKTINVTLKWPHANAAATTKSPAPTPKQSPTTPKPSPANAAQQAKSELDSTPTTPSTVAVKEDASTLKSEEMLDDSRSEAVILTEKEIETVDLLSDSEEPTESPVKAVKPVVDAKTPAVADPVKNAADVAKPGEKPSGTDTPESQKVDSQTFKQIKLLKSTIATLTVDELKLVEFRHIDADWSKLVTETGANFTCHLCNKSDLKNLAELKLHVNCADHLEKVNQVRGIYHPVLCPTKLVMKYLIQLEAQDLKAREREMTKENVKVTDPMSLEDFKLKHVFLPVAELLNVEYREKGEAWLKMIHKSGTTFKCGLCKTPYMGNFKNILEHVHGKKHLLAANTVKEMHHPVYCVASDRAVNSKKDTPASDAGKENLVINPMAVLKGPAPTGDTPAKKQAPPAPSGKKPTPVAARKDTGPQQNSQLGKRAAPAGSTGSQPQNKRSVPSAHPGLQPQNQQTKGPSFSNKIITNKPETDANFEGYVGVEYVVKILRNATDPTPRFECCLCELESDGFGMQGHLKSSQHRLKFLDRHFRTVMRDFEGFRNDPTCKNVLGEIARRLSVAIEKHHGRDLPFECLQEEYRLNRPEIMAKVFSFRHASEYSGPSMIHVIDKMTLHQMLENRQSFGNLQPESKRRTTFDINDEMAPKRHRMDESGRYMDVDEHRRLVDQFLRNTNRDNAERRPRSRSRARSLSRGRSRERWMEQNMRMRRSRSRSLGRRRSRSGDMWSAYKRMFDHAIRDLDTDYKRFERDPETHPLYQKEWKIFWQKRSEELANDGRNPSTYDFQPEWILFWTRRMDQIYEEEVDNLKKKLRDRLNLPYHNNDLRDRRYHIGNHRQPMSAFSQIRQNMDNMGPGGPMPMGPGEPLMMGLDGPRMDGPGGRPMGGMGGPRMGGPAGPFMGGPDRPNMGGPVGPHMAGPGGPHMGGPGGPFMGGPGGPNLGGPDMMGRGGPDMMGRGGPDMMGRGGPGVPPMMGPGGDMPFNMNQMQSNAGPYDTQWQQGNMPSQNMGPFDNQQKPNRPGPNFGPQGMPQNINAQPGPVAAPRNNLAEVVPLIQPVPAVKDNRPQPQRFIRPLMPEMQMGRQPNMNVAQMQQKPQQQPTQKQPEKLQQNMQRNVGRGDQDNRTGQAPKDSFKNTSKGGQQMNEARADSRKDKQRGEPEIADEELMDSGPLSVVSVLRMLTALEDHLGILGPRVVDLMSKALTYEKAKPGSADKNLMTQENAVFLETVREKLRGQIVVGVLDASKTRAVNKAIKDVSELLNKAVIVETPAPVHEKVVESARPQNAGVSAARQAQQKQTANDAEEKRDLAAKLAAALAAQGKTNVTSDQLEQLIAVYSLIEKKQKENIDEPKKQTLSDLLVDSLKVTPATSANNMNDDRNAADRYEMRGQQQQLMQQQQQQMQQQRYNQQQPQQKRNDNDLFSNMANQNNANQMSNRGYETMGGNYNQSSGYGQQSNMPSFMTSRLSNFDTSLSLSSLPPLSFSRNQSQQSNNFGNSSQNTPAFMTNMGRGTGGGSKQDMVAYPSIWQRGSATTSSNAASGAIPGRTQAVNQQAPMGWQQNSTNNRGNNNWAQNRSGRR